MCCKFFNSRISKLDSLSIGHIWSLAYKCFLCSWSKYITFFLLQILWIMSSIHIHRFFLCLRLKAHIHVLILKAHIHILILKAHIHVLILKAHIYVLVSKSYVYFIMRIFTAMGTVFHAKLIFSLKNTVFTQKNCMYKKMFFF